jgi:hypothetical protein
MKKDHKKLLTFLVNNEGWQWYSNDRQTKKLVDKLVARNENKNSFWIMVISLGK